jgi:hypothetical protein
MSKTTTCSTHGDQGIGLVCIHVARAIDTGADVGFFWGDETDTARPDAWCASCERKLVALNGSNGDLWFREADFKVLCAACWDEARSVLYERPRAKPR